MKNLLKLLFSFIFVTAMACSDSDGDGDPTLEIFTEFNEVHFFDKGNGNNASDLGIGVTLTSTEGIEEMRFVVLKRNSSLDKSLSFLEGLESDRYHSIFPIGDKVEYISSLTSAMNDVDGDPIQNGVEYFVQIYFVGPNAVSRPSKIIQLEEAPVLTGFYEGSWEFLGIGNRITVLLTGEGNSYTGETAFIDSTEGNRIQGDFNFELVNNNVPSLEYHYRPFVLEKEVNSTCIGIYSGEGTASEDLTRLTFMYTGKTCDGVDTAGTITLKRNTK